MSTRAIRRAEQRRLLREQRRARRRAIAAGATGAVLLIPGSAHAANLNVTSVADSGANTLRAALTTANANNQDDTVTFSGAAAAPGAVIRLSTPLVVTTDVHRLNIRGPGRDILTISGDTNANNTPDTQVLQITTDSSSADAAVTISGVTLTRGTSANGGGAIHAKGPSNSTVPLILTDAAVTNSVSTSNSSNSEGGGGINTVGDLTLTRTKLTGNSATQEPGGAVFATEDEVIVTGSDVSGNSAPSGGGIALKYTGSLTVNDSTITGNQGVGSSSSGGGIAVGLAGLHVERSTISGNSAARGGGVSAATAKYDSYIEDSTISGNTATEFGGGAVIDPIKYEGGLRNTTVTGNKAPVGAGVTVLSYPAGRAVIDRSTVTGNGNSGTTLGGGVAIGEAAGGFELLNSTVSGNTATNGGGIADGIGENVFKYSDHQLQGSIDLDNSTVSGNTGGGIFLNSYQRTSSDPHISAQVTMNSTIVSGNGVDTDRKDDAIAGGITASFSLIQTPGDAPLTATALITGKDPLLGGLADNGGPTKTMLPAGNSPVLDAGRGGATIPTDQRGQPRTVDTGLGNQPGADGTDIGAVELPASSVTVPPPPIPPVAVLTVSAGKAPIAPVTPLLPASVTPFTCTVTLVQLTGCDVVVRSLAKVKVSKKLTIPAGTVLAEARSKSAGGAATLSSKAVLTSAGRSVLGKFPTGLDAGVSAVGSYGTSSALTAAGRVHLLAGPSITLKLTKRSSLATSVRRQLGTVGGLLRGAKTVSLTVTDPSTSRAKKLATAGGKALTAGGLKVKPKVSGAKSSTRRLKITFTL